MHHLFAGFKRYSRHIFGLETSQPFTHAGNHLMASDQELDCRFRYLSILGLCLMLQAMMSSKPQSDETELLLNLLGFKAWWVSVDHPDATSLFPCPAGYWSESDLLQTLSSQELSKIRRQLGSNCDGLDRESVHQILNHFKHMFGFPFFWRHRIVQINPSIGHLQA